MKKYVCPVCGLFTDNCYTPIVKVVDFFRAFTYVCALIDNCIFSNDCIFNNSA